MGRGSVRTRDHRSELVVRLSPQEHGYKLSFHVNEIVCGINTRTVEKVLLVAAEQHNGGVDMHVLCWHDAVVQRLRANGVNDETKAL